MDRRCDLSIALVLIAVAVFVILVARAIPMGMHKDAVGPRAFYYGIGILFILGGGFLTIQRLRNWKTQTDPMIPSEGTEDEPGYPSSAKRSAGIVGIAIGYAILLKPLGYLLSTPLFIAGALVVMGERKKRQIALLSIVYTVFFYVVFAQMLSIWIPVGPFTDLFRDLGWIIL